MNETGNVHTQLYIGVQRLLVFIPSGEVLRTSAKGTEFGTW